MWGQRSVCKNGTLGGSKKWKGSLTQPCLGFSILEAKKEAAY